MSNDDSDPIDEVRNALWGEVDDGSRRVGRRIAREGADGPVGRRVETHRRLRDVFSRIEAGAAPPELKAWLQREVAARRAEEPEVDVSWLVASPVLAGAGIRSSAGDQLLACVFSGGELLAQVHVEDDGGACAVTGRLLGPDRKPVSARPVALYVDRRLREAVVTDERGEFTFDDRRGLAFGVCVGEGAGAVHIALADFTRRIDEPGQES